MAHYKYPSNEQHLENAKWWADDLHITFAAGREIPLRRLSGSEVYIPLSQKGLTQAISNAGL